MQLAAKVRKFQHESGIVLAVPRGGVPVAYYVAKELGFPIEIILTKKIGHPSNKEYAIGAASLYDYFIVPHEEVTEVYIKEEVENIRMRLKEMHRIFMDDEQPANVEGKTVIVVDDGIATGNTLLGTVQLLRRGKPGKIIIAAHVASKSAVAKLEQEVDEVITVLSPEIFYGVGAFYEDFSQVTDEEVLDYLNKFKELKIAV
jgi:putative phosphoribosyl transferase